MSVEHRILHGWIALLLLIIVSVTPAQAAKPEVSISKNPQVVVLRYSESPVMILGDDPFNIEIFGDGRVRIHYPRTMKKAGDYEFYLSDKELQQLFDNAAESGVLDFDEISARRDLLYAEQQAKETGLVHYRSDGMDTELEFSVEHYVDRQGRQPLRTLKKQVRWSKLLGHSKSYPGIKSLKNLTDFKRRVKNLEKGRHLKRVQP